MAGRVTRTATRRPGPRGPCCPSRQACAHVAPKPVLVVPGTKTKTAPFFRSFFMISRQVLSPSFSWGGGGVTTGTLNGGKGFRSPVFTRV